MDGPFALEAKDLGKSYRSGQWALRHCDFTVPAGRICGVVGPNGAGKSTLFGLAARLFAPSEGELRVLGESVRTRATPELRARVAHVTQEKPLYRTFTVADTLRLGRELNPNWDQQTAQRVVELGELSPTDRIGALSGGQRSRVALALTLGKRAELLLLDEPFADLDPLARHELTGILLARAAEHGTTVLISSHLVSELEDVLDHVLLVQSGGVRLAGDLDELLDAHRLVSGLADAERPAGQVVEWRVTGRQATGLIRTGVPGAPAEPLPARWEATRPRLDELLLAHLRNPAGTASPTGTGGQPEPPAPGTESACPDRPSTTREAAA
ncbi:ABC transporter ATP-binding protein [Kitasatospora cheerisanensis]|uniref:ABC transporter ATP-binding protein n=1 Tax=Kitasatospora cheerisanensis KCTC 2395 TaxID=1348663 RepID=A0A066ZB08_9ACTN|nr:ABC transporter ATP-binding protein [Kitasatospora cheerisanensis]KDN87501.1 ABC transporter ATP-binding protein [Kitasatospora cheerisanensis KCTC 2395]